MVAAARPKTGSHRPRRGGAGAKARRIQALRDKRRDQRRALAEKHDGDDDSGDISPPSVASDEADYGRDSDKDGDVLM